jgi:GTPase Era involved in 16S rRNA processing
MGEFEMTGQTKGYPCPEADHVVFWDLPGAGTPDHPAAGYFDSKCLFAFDALIVVCDDRFGEVDLQIVDEAVQWRVPVLFVCNKFDNAFQAYVKCKYRGTDLDERVKRSAVNHLVQTLTDKIHETMSCFPCLSGYKIYVLSAWAFHEETIIAGEESRFVHDLAGQAALRVCMREMLRKYMTTISS